MDSRNNSILIILLSRNNFELLKKLVDFYKRFDHLRFRNYQSISDFYQAPQVLHSLGPQIIILSCLLVSQGQILPRTNPIKRLVPRFLIMATTVDHSTISFTSQLVQAIDRILPSKLVKCHHSEKPQITPAIKNLIRDTQKEFHCQNIPL